MSTPFDAPDWRGMNQEDRDRGLNNGVAVAGSADIVVGWERRSAEMRGQYSDHLDLRYGPRERNRIDFLKAREKGPYLRSRWPECRARISRESRSQPATMSALPATATPLLRPRSRSSRLI